METDKDQRDDTALERLFDGARRHEASPSDAFMARLTADALAAVPHPETRQPQQAGNRGFARFKAWFAASGLSGAAALGVWMGFVMPDIVTSVSPVTEDVSALSVFLPASDLSVLGE